jgi:hypothetical protein
MAIHTIHAIPTILAIHSVLTIQTILTLHPILYTLYSPHTTTLSQLVEEVTAPVWERASASLKESTENEGFGLELGLISLKVLRR